MPISVYEQASAKLTSDATAAVAKVFDAWSSDTARSQIVQNVSNETALAIDDFATLLDSFSAQLTSGKSPVNAWLTACRDHKLRGVAIPAEDCPAILGRAKSLGDHANSIEKASGGALTAGEVRKLLLKYSGAFTPIGFETFLRAAPLGRFNLVWAIFDSADSHAEPFDRLPLSRRGICTALGLGHLTAEDTLIVLVWDHVDSGSPPLHRPTVADAEDSRFYRPRTEADSRWGLTEPLLPNPDGLPPQPEVVMPETTSKGLRLPFRVVQA